VGADAAIAVLGQQLTISGARPQQNNYRSRRREYKRLRERGAGSVMGGNLGVDAIQEFSVLNEQLLGRVWKDFRGVVNAVTRSGTNGLHGSVTNFSAQRVGRQKFLRSSSNPARSSGTSSVARLAAHYQNRTFFFADYEGIRQSKGITAVTTVPSLLPGQD